MRSLSLAKNQRVILATEDQQEPEERSEVFVPVGIRGLACHDSLGMHRPWQTATGFLVVDEHNCALAFFPPEARANCCPMISHPSQTS
jgi:hypothetical protein